MLPYPTPSCASINTALCRHGVPVLQLFSETMRELYSALTITSDAHQYANMLGVGEGAHSGRSTAVGCPHLDIANQCSQQFSSVAQSVGVQTLEDDGQPGSSCGSTVIFPHKRDNTRCWLQGVWTFCLVKQFLFLFL